MCPISSGNDGSAVVTTERDVREHRRRRRRRSPVCSTSRLRERARLFTLRNPFRNLTPLLLHAARVFPRKTRQLNQQVRPCFPFSFPSNFARTFHTQHENPTRGAGHQHQQRAGKGFIACETFTFVPVQIEIRQDPFAGTKTRQNPIHFITVNKQRREQKHRAHFDRTRSTHEIPQKAPHSCDVGAIIVVRGRRTQCRRRRRRRR